MPVYNGGRYVAESIESILNQSFRDFELVISDNASDDETGDICKRYQSADPRIRYHRNDRNIGAAPNFNRTVEQSRGDYFTWAAHDDVYADTYLERTVAVLDGRPDVVLVYTGVRLIGEQGRDLKPEPDGDGHIDSAGSRIMALDVNHLAEGVNASDRFHDALHGINWCLQVFGVIRTDVLRRTHLQRSYYGADKVLLAELALQGRFQQVETLLFAKRVHADMSFYKSVKEKREWIDPNATHWLPQVQMLRDYTIAVVRSDLSGREKARCFRHIAKMFRRPGLLRRIFVPGPENYLGLNFSRSN